MARGALGLPRGFIGGLSGGLTQGMNLRRQMLMDDLARKQQERDNAFREAAQAATIAQQKKNQELIDAQIGNFKADNERQAAQQAEAERNKRLAQSLQPWGQYDSKEVKEGLGPDLPGTGSLYDESLSNRTYALDGGFDPATQASVEDEVWKRDTELLRSAAERAAKIRGELFSMEKQKAANSVSNAEARAIRVLPVQGGGYGVVNPLDPNPTARPVTNPDGSPTKKDKTISEGTSVRLGGIAEEVRAIDDLEKRFKDHFAGGGPLGGVATRGYQIAGSLVSNEAQDDAQFWADFAKFVDIPNRHEKFGASLTRSEDQSWKAASNINPRSPPEDVRKALRTLRTIRDRVLRDNADALIEQGYAPGAVGKLTGTEPDGQAWPKVGGGTQAAIQTRIAQLKASGITDRAAIKAKLKEEGLVQ